MMKQNQIYLDGMSPAQWLAVCRQTIKRAQRRGQNPEPLIRLQKVAFQNFKQRFESGL